MAGKQEVKLTFAGDDKSLSKTFGSVGTAAQQMESKVGRSASGMASSGDKATKGLGRSFQYAKGAIVASGITSAIGGVTRFLGDMIGEARESVKVSASTAQGIKTIGASSWTSAQQIGELSQKISEKIGVDDELIQQSANLLLTFKNVKNAAGENNDVFNRAVMASQDLAAKGFGSADSAAKMLGKALNDPIKGITALSRAGVTFTQGQKDQIEKLVESGDLLGAQKIIMGELEAQIGGTAEATATAGDKMATTWANFQENLGTAVLPLLDGLLHALTPILEWAGQNPVIVGAIAAVTAGIWLLNAALAANPIILIISLIAALVAALVILWTKNAAFRDFFINAWHGIQNVAGAVAGWIRDRWNWLMGFFRGVGSFFAGIGRAIGGVFRTISSVVSSVAGAIVGSIQWVIDRIRDAISWISSMAAAASGGVFGGGGVSLSGGGGQFKRHHSGGVVSGGIPGQEVLRTLQVGEKVVPRGQAAKQGGGQLVVVGDVDSLFATYLRKLVRDGTLRVA